MQGVAGAMFRLQSSPFVVLWRTFVSQFFSSESFAAEVHLRQTVASVLAFLLVPGIFIVFQVLPSYSYLVLRASVLGTPEIVDQFLTALASVFVAFSTVTIGFIAAFLWDSLGFERRDAAVLGPLPLRGPAVIAAKISALTALLLGASIAVNLVTAVPFALVTADRPEGPGPLGHLAAHLTATVGAATFVFASTVLLRGAVGLLPGVRGAAAVGSTLQFLFVSALLSVLVLIPAVSPARFQVTNVSDFWWVPPAWFIGVFERGLDLSRPRFVPLADIALPATSSVVLGALVVSVLGFRRQMRLALVPSVSSGPPGGAGFGRLAASALVGRDPVARATADFVLRTLARTRAPRVPIAMNAAVGLALVVAALSRVTTDLESLQRPRTAVLWIPLVLAYWLVVGLRASFFVPSELPASWTFKVNGPGATAAYWSAVRASMLAFVLPRMLAIVALLVPFVGLRTASWHALVSTALLVLLVEIVALTIRRVPFTREYLPGHARLKTRWPVYLFGMFAFAYWPTKLEIRLLDNPAGLLAMVSCIGAAAVALAIVGRLLARRWPWWQIDDPDEDSVTVLDIGGPLEERALS